MWLSAYRDIHCIESQAKQIILNLSLTKEKLIYTTHTGWMPSDLLYNLQFDKHYVVRKICGCANMVEQSQQCLWNVVTFPFLLGGGGQ